ncbi:MAG: hypothetical protein MI923_00810 [Phycisphaerales bacterium]|nr:hypothetical protein [Phycisphaerales bacterium]
MDNPGRNAAVGAAGHKERIESKVDATLNERLTRMGQELSATFSTLIDAMPGGPHRASDLSRKLRVNKDASSRLLRAIRQPDPVAVTYMIPGPDPLRRILTALDKLKVDSAAIQKARTAVQNFEDIIASEAGDRGALDAIISAWLPEAREKRELAAKQTAFRGMTLIKGMSCDLSLNVALLVPSPRKKFYADFVALMGVKGLRRFNDSARLQMASWTCQVEQPLTRRQIDGSPAQSANELRLKDYCSAHGTEFEQHELENTILYTVAPPDVGISAACDIVMAELQQDAMMVVRPDSSQGEGHAFISNEITTPARVSILDVLLPDEIFADVEPTVQVFDAGFRGFVDVNDPLRQFDRYRTNEQVHDCGRGVAGLRLAESSRYVEMLEYACSTVGVAPNSLRAYRVRVEYPIYGSQICMIFPRKPAPAD